MALKFFDAVRQLTATEGEGSSIALGAAFAAHFFTLAEAGAVNDDEVYYRVDDGGNVEIQGPAVVSDNGDTVARGTPLISKIGGTVGTTKLDLSGNAEISIVAPAEILNAILAVIDSLGDAAFMDVADAVAVKAKTADRPVPAEHLFSPLVPAALAIVSNDVAINLALGRKFTLTFDDDFELQLPTNAVVGDEFIVHLLADGGGDTPSFASGYLGDDDTDPADYINTGDTERTRLHCEVTAVTEGTATEVLVVPAGGLWGNGA
jgi:hypothetical protein